MAVSITTITDKVIGTDSTPSHCEQVTMMGLNVIDEATFLPRVPSNTPSFFYQPSMKGRMGIFRCVHSLPQGHLRALRNSERHLPRSRSRPVYR
jgi:hypothetical protein